MNHWGAASAWSSRGRVLAGAVVAALLVVGCGGSGGSSEDKGKKLETIIRDQLPGKAKAQGIGPILVGKVGCTNADGNKFDCIASVRSTDGKGGTVGEDVPIDGTCDDDSCVWKTASGQIPEPAPPSPSADDSAASGESGADEGELEVIRARLESAGYKVEDEEPGSDEGSVGGLVAVVKDANYKVLLFENDEAAARTEGGLQAVKQEAPGQVEVKRQGPLVFNATIEEPATLPPGEFDKFIEAAQSK